MLEHSLFSHEMNNINIENVALKFAILLIYLGLKYNIQIKSSSVDIMSSSDYCGLAKKNKDFKIKLLRR